MRCHRSRHRACGISESCCRWRRWTGRAASEAVANLDASLRRLSTDYVDVLLLHGVRPEDYDDARDVLKPALLAEKAKGKFCYLGISETPPNDPGQIMLQRALDDPTWQDMMLAYHMLNQGARRYLLSRTKRQSVGTLLMYVVYVVRNMFSKPGSQMTRSVFSFTRMMRGT